MPTYKNNTNEILWVSDYTNNKIKFDPGQEIETLKILDDVNLTVTSEEPYYNTIINESEVILATSAASGSLDIDPSSSFIRIIPITDNILLNTVKVYINSFSNLPGMTLNEVVTITNKGKINKLYFDSGPGIINIKEIK